MIAKTLVPALLLLASAGGAQVPNPDSAPEAAQDRGYDVQTPKHDAVDAQEVPVTESLNDQAGRAAAVNEIAGEVDQEQYRSDMEAYRADVAAHAAATARDDARYARQQRAYADAMAQWRAQTAACDRGKLKACKLPTPNPADYY